MKNWIQRLLALFRPAPPAPPAANPARAAAPQPKPPAAAPQPKPPAAAPDAAAPSWGAEVDIDGLYFRLLLGSDAREDAASEARALNALEHLSRSNLNAAELVPRVPAVIPNLLKSLRDRNVSGAHLAQEIGRDAVLVAEVLRQANSSYYRPAETITSLEGAVLLLGLNGLRMLIAKAAFHPVINLQTGRLAKMAAPHIWEHSDKCVHACRRLAHEHEVDPFEAFLGGLLQNVGLIVALRVVDAALRGHPLPASRSVLTALPYYARLLSCRIGREWDFPPQVVAAVEEQGRLSVEHEKSGLGKLLYRADQLGKLWVLNVNGKVFEQDIEQAFWLSDSDIECFRELKTLTS